MSRRFFHQVLKMRARIVLPTTTVAIGGFLFDKSEKNSNIYSAIASDDYGSVYKCIKTGQKTNQYHKYGWTPLHLAAAWNDEKMVKMLLESGADPDLQEKYVKPVAKQFGQHYTQAMLSADDEEKLKVRKEQFPTHLSPKIDYRGATALFYAVLNDNHQMAKLLIDAGADPLVKLHQGISPIEVVDESSKNGLMIKDLLLKAIKNRDALLKEKRKKYPLESRLSENIIGQKAAIKQVAAAIRRKENGWVDSDHPVVMIFLGSSGIGKTELAKQVAKYIHGNMKEGFVRIDMSEYSSQHEVARLIGAPPGYVGHDKGGQLTEALTKCPNAVVLFDEIEKAHPDALPILLQLFDEGRMTDGQGKTIECKDAIFIMTSNLASGQIADYGVALRSKGEEKTTVDKEFRQSVVKPILKFHFKRDEFLGRINEFVYFLPFSDSELRELVEFELGLWKRIAKDKHDIELSWEEAVISVLADGYEVSYGARSVKHESERKVVSALAEAYETGKLSKNMKVVLSCNLPKNVEDYQHVQILLKNKETGSFI